MTRLIRPVLLAFAFPAALATPAVAGDCSAALGGSAVFPALDARYVSRSKLAFDFGPASGEASQTLALTARDAAGVAASVTCFTGEHLGFAASFSRFGSSLEGDNGPYQTSLRYESAQPPDYQPRTYSYSTSTEWPPTEGQLTEWALGAAIVGRWRPSPRTALMASAGLAYVRASGEGESLAATVLRLGGHSVLFPETYRLAYAIGAGGHFGADLGFAAEQSLSGRLALRLAYRALLVPEADVRITVTGLAHPEEVMFTRDAAALAGQLDLPAAKLDLSSSQLSLSLALRF